MRGHARGEVDAFGMVDADREKRSDKSEKRCNDHTESGHVSTRKSDISCHVTDCDVPRHTLPCDAGHATILSPVESSGIEYEYNE